MIMDDSSSKDKLVAEIDDILLWCTVAAPFIVLLVFSPFNMDSYSLPKLTALFLITLFLTYFQMRRWLEEGVIRVPIHKAFLLVGVFLLVLAITTFSSANPLASLIGRFERYETLPAYICYAILFWFSFKAAQENGFKQSFNALFMVTFTVINIFGLFDALGANMSQAAVKNAGRIASTIGNPVFFGAFLAISLPILIAKALFPPEQRKRFWDDPRVAFALIGLGLAMLVSTISRGAWLGAVIGSLIPLYKRFKSRKNSSIKGARYPYWLLLVPVGIVSGILLSASVNSGTSSVVNMASSPSSLGTRIELWKSSLQMIAHKPLTGYGLGQTNDWINPFLTLKFTQIESGFVDRVHNIYLQSVIDGGALLLLAQLWLITYVVLKGLRAARNNSDYLAIGFLGALIGYLVQGLSGIATNDLSLFFWCIMGSVVGNAVKGTSRVIEWRVAQGAALKWLALVVLVALSIAALTPPVLEARYSAADSEVRTTMSESALKGACDAAQYLAVQPHYQWFCANLCLDLANDTKDASVARLAITVAKRGLRYSPNYPQLIHTLGTAYLVSARYSRNNKDLGQAEKYLYLALQKAPLDKNTYIDVIMLNLQKGNYDEVIRVSKLLGSIDPQGSRPLISESVAYELKGDKNKADTLLKSAQKLDPGAQSVWNTFLGLAKTSPAPEVKLPSGK